MITRRKSKVIQCDVMTLSFGIRPFDFPDFMQMIKKGDLDISEINYIDVVSSTFQQTEALFQHFEITCDLAYVLPDLLNVDVIERLNDLKTLNNYSCSVHLPLWGIELAAPNLHIRKASIDCIVDAINLTKPLNPICWVIHATGSLISEFNQIDLPESGKIFLNNHFANQAKESLEEILIRTEIAPRKLAVENVEFPFDQMEECIEELDLSICFDTGHLQAGFSGYLDGGVLEFVERYYNRIVELHLHDGKLPRIDHSPLGYFDLPVKELLNYLLERNFKGPIVFELSPEEVNESILYIKKNIPNAL